MIRIVIADDSEMARSFIQRCLEIVLPEQAAIVEASNGKEALSKMKEAHTDLLITDLNMPVMNGESLLEHIISSPKLHGTPSIVITSLKNPARVECLKKAGASAILGKPVKPAELGQAIETIFGKEDIDDYGA